MSLGGLAVAIGIIIDDAVVVVENIERRLTLHPDEPAAAVIRQGTDEIFGPVAGSTLTTVVVFAPLGLLSGVVGEFFRSFATALAVSVLVSLVLAMTLIPTIVAQWVTGSRHEPPASLAAPARAGQAGGALWKGDRVDARAPRRRAGSRGRTPAVDASDSPA